VDLMKTRVSDIRPLAGKKKLKELFLMGSLVEDFEPIRDIIPQMTKTDVQLP